MALPRNTLLSYMALILIKENVIIGSKAPHINRPLIIGVALVNTGIPLENTEKYSQGRP